MDGQARLVAALPAALARIQATPGVYAALWCGSAARGEGNAHSDLDVHALVTGDHRWRSNFMVQGVPVEVFHNPAHTVRAMFAAGEGDTITMYAQGRVVLPHPDLHALTTEARRLYAAGPTPRPVTQQERHRLIDEVLDARALAETGDPLHVLIACRAASLAVEGWYTARGWWGVKAQGWLPGLTERDPDAAADLRTVLTSAEAHTRQRALEALVRRVAGDVSYSDGQSDPQRMP